MKKYTHLFFDLDNTLWDFEKNSFNALGETFRNFDLVGKGVDFQNFYEIYCQHNSRLWIDYRNGSIVKNELKRLRFQQTFDSLKIAGVDPDEMNRVYLEEMAKQTVLVEGASGLLNFLSSHGFQMAIITNGFREVQLKKLENCDLLRYFSKVFISEDIKASKPSPKIFEYAITSSNAKKMSSLMVGDDYDIDIIGALQFGIDAVWLTGHAVTNANASRLYGRVYPVRYLHEIPVLLKKTALL